MANVFKQAALAFGRWTRFNREPVQQEQQHEQRDAQLVLIEPVAEAMTGEQGNPIDALIDAQLAEQQAVENGNQYPAVSDAPRTDAWDAAHAPSETAGTGVIGLAADAPAPTAEPVVNETLAVVNETLAVVAESTTFTPAPEADLIVAAAPTVVEEVTAPIEMKPEPLPAAPVVTPDPALAFTQLYEMISTEVTKRTDTTVAVYERLLAATREELDATRRNNRFAWSVGGVMTAVAAFGAIWSAGEVSSHRGELTGLKQQVSAAQQFAAERDALRAEMQKISQANAKLEIDALKSRLDEALALTADRDRLRGEVETLKKANQDAQSELRIARTAATTQPVSYSQPLNEKVITAARRAAASITAKAAGSERQDVWSVLLNGGSDE
jgi:hypothetical protein